MSLCKTTKLFKPDSGHVLVKTHLYSVFSNLVYSLGLKANQEKLSLS